jgi:hypothetical protein
MQTWWQVPLVPLASGQHSGPSHRVPAHDMVAQSAFVVHALAAEKSGSEERTTGKTKARIAKCFICQSKFVD